MYAKRTQAIRWILADGAKYRGGRLALTPDLQENVRVPLGSPRVTRVLQSSCREVSCDAPCSAKVCYCFKEKNVTIDP